MAVAAAGTMPAQVCGGDCPLVWRGEQCEKAGRGAACSTCTARKRRIAAAKSPAKLQKKLGQAKRRKRQADLPKHFDGVDAAAATAAVPAVQALAEEATNPAPAEGVASFAVLAPGAAAAVPTPDADAETQDLDDDTSFDLGADDLFA